MDDNVSYDEKLYDAVRKKIGDFEVIETHMSRVYLGRHEVIKTFKSIDLGFVDMTPLEKRRESCINTALIDTVYSPDLNTRVATVISLDGLDTVREGVVEESGLGRSEIIKDYAVVMRRFDSQSGLSVLYESGHVTDLHAKQIGHLLADAHRKAETSGGISRIGYVAITSNFDECFRITQGYVGKSIFMADYDIIHSCYQKFVSQNAEYLRGRMDNGFIRRCHGDAHSGNMFVEDGRVKIFDGIGFKDEFSFMDVVADFAFAYMDAVVHGYESFAEVMKKAYVGKTGDSEGVERLLDFYVAYRAFVRGEVTTMKALGMPDAEKEKLFSEAGKYFELSKKYILKSVGMEGS